MRKREDLGGLGLGGGSGGVGGGMRVETRLELGVLVTEGRGGHRLAATGARRARVTVGRHTIGAVPRHAHPHPGRWPRRKSQHAGASPKTRKSFIHIVREGVS
eukprot:scaffold55191_cov57-Phaeocystis_antarctica.AAC.3